MTVIIDGTNGVQSVGGSASTASFTKDGDTNNGIFFPATDVTAITTAGTERLRIDASGNAGLGVTPSAWTSSYSVLQFGVGASLATYKSSILDELFLSANAFENTSGNWTYIGSAPTSQYFQAAGKHAWRTAASGTAGNAITWTQAMTLDASSNLMVGGTTAESKLNVYSGGSTFSSGTVPAGMTIFGNTNDGQGSMLSFKAGSGDQGIAGIAGLRSSGYQTELRFYTNSTNSQNAFTERARITAGGYSKFSNDGVYADSAGTFHEFRNTANDHCLIVRSTNASQTTDVFVVQGARNTTDNTYYVIQYFNTGAAATRFRVADSGNVTNTNGSYGTISDAKMKTDIVDAGSQWADLKAVQFRKFKMKDDPSGLMQLGVVAQELEQTSPGLVEEHKDTDAEGNDLGTTTKSVKTSVLLMKAAVALQEAMARIEKLEAEMAALKGA